MAQTVSAIILAGGTGTRMGLAIPKQYLEIGDEMVLERTLRVFDSVKVIDRLVIVVQTQWFDHVTQRLRTSKGWSKDISIVVGGDTRQASVYNGLQAVRDSDYILVHDAVRPFVTTSIIEAALDAAMEHGASDVCVKAIDTLVEAVDGFITGILDRSRVYHGQTPQAFRTSILLQAHDQAMLDGITSATDDCQLVLRLGYPVRIVEGAYSNMKITTTTDFKFANWLAQEDATR